MAFRIIRPDELSWITRPHEPGEPARHVAELSELAGFAHTRGNLWRYEPGARGKRHRHPIQEETFVVLAGTLSMYLGEPPERHDVPTRGLIHVEPGTELQTANHGDEELVVYAYGTPPESEHAEILDPVIESGSQPSRYGPGSRFGKRAYASGGSVVSSSTLASYFFATWSTV